SVRLDDRGAGNFASVRLDDRGAGNFASVRNAGQRNFGPLQKNSLSSVVQSFKAAVTRWCKKNNHQDFCWHGRFYDHIVHNEGSLNRICLYIRNNPPKWQNDVENKIKNISEWQIQNHCDRLFDK
ncbi:hypothetical protein JW758_02620, partial [Candidatus Peregrinibacteria bacterium]|nr:hypothetical protein [Candidatus Peregrinibacteria bacterium]